MAKFEVDFPWNNYGFLDASDETLSVDELLNVIRPAALYLRDAYRKTLSTLFNQPTGQLVDSIDIDDDFYIGKKYGDENRAYYTVAPSGYRKRGHRKARSRAGPANRKYAKHNRTAVSRRLSNRELAYYLEYGTPRIKATHWMENTNEAVSGELQGMIAEAVNDLLEQKGL